MSIILLTNMTNNAILRKILGIDRNLIAALGALGKGSNPVAPTHEKQVILASFPDSLFYCLLLEQ